MRYRALQLQVLLHTHTHTHARMYTVGLRTEMLVTVSPAGLAYTNGE